MILKTIVNAVHDNDPVKYVLCVKDVLSGIVLPWHLDTQQKQMITSMIVTLDNAAQDRIEDHMLLVTVDECITNMSKLVLDSKPARATYEKFERARFTMVHIRNSLEKLLM